MKILIFGGTTEGRKLSAALSKAGHDIKLSVATEYGATIATQSPSLPAPNSPPSSLLTHHSSLITPLSSLNSPLPPAPNSPLSSLNSPLDSPLDRGEMLELLEKSGFDCVIDATHPYAAEVTRNIRSACRAAGIKYHRLIRPESAVNPNIKYVPDAASAVETLNENDEKALLTVGSKDLVAFTQVKNFTQRLFIRILPMQESLKKAHELGYRGSNIICMQGPFDKAMNTATIKMTGAKFLVTKESGDIGGFEEKTSAAESLGCKVIVLARPGKETGSTYDELLEAFGIIENREQSEPQNMSFVQNFLYTRKDPASSFFPLFVDIKDKVTLIIGGGKVAERRIETLMPYGAIILVISPKVTKKIKAAAEQGKIILVEKKYAKGDITGLEPFLVIAATDDRQTNHEAMKEATKLNMQISVADSREECTCYFPAIAQNENFIAGLISKKGDHKGVKMLAERIRNTLLT